MKKMCLLLRPQHAARGHPSSHALNARSPSFPPTHLEGHRVWPVGTAEAESGAEVVDEVSLLLDGREQGLVDGLLVCDTVLGGLLLLHVVSITSEFPIV